MKKEAKVTIIICTTAEKKRKDSLERAINSILDQTQKSIPLVVVNGDKFDKDIFDNLCAEENINVVYQKEGSLPQAIGYGRQCIRTPFFGYLDDDDILTKDAISKRIKPLEQDLSLAAVVTNGERITNNKIKLIHENILIYQSDPLLSLLTANWLASCAGLFRSKFCTPDIFSKVTPYHEWTDIAFRISLLHKISFIPDSTYQITNSPESLSKSEDYKFATLQLLNNMKGYVLPKNVKQKIAIKLTAAHHDLSEKAMINKNLKMAWKHHLQSIISACGMKYFPFTRHLILRSCVNFLDIFRRP